MKFDIKALKEINYAGATKGQMVILAEYRYFEGTWLFSEHTIKSVSAQKGMITLDDTTAPRFSKIGKELGKYAYSRNESVLLEHNPENLKVVQAYQKHRRLVLKTTVLFEKLVANDSRALKNMSVEKLQELYEFIAQNSAPKDA